MTAKITRAKQTPQPFLVPRRVDDPPGGVLVDCTWGTIHPIKITAGVRTVGEVEVIAHLEEGLPLIDSRTSDFYLVSTIPGAHSIPYPEAVAHMDELGRGHPAIFFCNGPQCGQSPTAIQALIEAGYPSEKILYYRGGLHDWITLGLPVVPGKES
jgi:rhodanese-related sulfurtransferase